MNKNNFERGEIESLYFDQHPIGCNCDLHQAPIYSLALENRRTIIIKTISNLLSTGDTKAAQKALQGLYSANYTKAIESVFKLPAVGSVEWEKAQSFKHNAERMATYKTNRLLDEIQAKCTGTEAENKEIAKGLVNKYNSYQGTEYNTMVARSRSAKQLLTFEKTKHVYPNVEWIMTRSANPREAHLVYVGRIFSLEDEWLQSNLPGSLYGCKCDLKQTREAVTDRPTETVTPAKGLEGNPNTTGLLITDKHPYFDVSKKVKQEQDKFLSKTIRKKNLHYGQENLVGTYTTAAIGEVEQKISFTSNGLKHFIHDNSDLYDQKNMLLPFLPELVKMAKFVKSAPNVKEKVFVTAFHYLEIKLFGKPMYFNIRELNGEFSLYSVTEYIR